MIDFEQEIETRLDKFQFLTGKGNVKDSNRTLYEIVRLMLGMINQREPRHPFNMHQNKPTNPLQPIQPIHEAITPTSEQTPPATLLDPVKDAVNAALAETAVSEPTMSPDPEPEVISAQTPATPNSVAKAIDETPKVVPGKDPRRTVHAPYGFTAAGNVRRKRDRKKG